MAGFEQVTKIDPENVRAHLWLAHALEFVCEYKRQKQIAHRGLALDPQETGFHLIIANTVRDLLYIKQVGDMHEAYDNLYQAIEKEPDWL